MTASRRVEDRCVVLDGREITVHVHSWSSSPPPGDGASIVASPGWQAGDVITAEMLSMVGDKIPETANRLIMGAHAAPSTVVQLAAVMRDFGLSVAEAERAFAALNDAFSSSRAEAVTRAEVERAMEAAVQDGEAWLRLAADAGRPDEEPPPSRRAIALGGIPVRP